MVKVNSILTSMKKLLNIAECDDSFDPDLIIHINSTFDLLHQLGVGPDNGFIITSDLETWEDYEKSSEFKVPHYARDYMYARLRLIFDPPANSFTVESLKELIKEYEWRLTVDVDENKQRSLNNDL